MSRVSGTEDVDVSTTHWPECRCGSSSAITAATPSPSGSDRRIRSHRPAMSMVIHGGPGGDHSGFKPGFSTLAARMQLIYFDHRGQGRSAAADPATYTLDENVEDMEALRRHLGLGAIVSIGTSYGGMVAMAHAARYPDAVSHLVLIVTAAHGGFIPRAQAIVR